MGNAELASVARSLVPAGRGILAADESTGSIKRRFDSIGVASTAESRRAYRELLFTTPGAEEYISGVIMYDETLRQSTQDGTPFPQLLASKGIAPGIKVDTGAKALPFFPGETVTEGLDGLRERLAEYRTMGAKFAKWRAVIDVGEHIPSWTAIEANSHALARYAALCQEVGLVPIVEPEVLMDGGHDLARCEAVTSTVLEKVFYDLTVHRVEFEGMLLKPNMVISGKKSATQASAQEVAEATVRTLRRFVPAAVPGIVFLSGGQGPVQATENLNAMNKLGGNPWELSFSYGRALQEPSLKAWKGEAANVPEAKRAFYHRAKMNSLARYGKYSADAEKQVEAAAR